MGSTAGLAALFGLEAGAEYAMMPKTPRPKPPPLMETQGQATQAEMLAEARAAALARGRASTILTTNADTGDKLGP